MAPIRKTRSSSRRSSILKPSKLRQPLQDLNVTSLSTESSPTTITKLKRRVSFAETKHVKEFCNSLEQGTVWDNTYEEHDLSNLNILCISNKQCDVENVCKTNVEIRTDHYNDIRYSNSQTVDKLAITGTNICFTHDEIIQESLIAIDHEAVCSSTSREIESTYKQTTKKGMLPEPSPIINYNITAETNEPAVHPGNTNDDSMEITAVVSTKPYSLQETSMYQQGIENSNDIPKEMTGVVNTRLCNLQTETSYMERTKDLKDVSMQMTVAIPIRPYNLQEDKPNVKANKNYNDDSMEMITAVPTRLYSLQKETFAECTKNLKDTSMEMTTAVPTRLCNLQQNKSYMEHTKNFKDVSMEMTTAVPTRLCNLQRNKSYVEHTKNFKDVSMEMTTAVPTRLCNLQRDKSYVEHTKNFKDVSMEMTTAVSTRLCNLQQDKSYAEHTKNFKDVAMEITVAVPIESHNLQEEEPCPKSNKNYNDVSMEMTTAVPARLYTLQKEILLAERTKNLKDVSMEMTTAVPTKLRRLQGDILYTDHTKNLKDVSMEMTTAVSTKLCSLQEDTLYSNHTKNFKDVSMEITVAVPTESQNLQEEELCAKSYKNCNDVSMEMTTAVPARPCSLQKEILLEERTKNLKNISMEMTTAVSTKLCTLQEDTLFAECTKNLKDVSMEMTTAVSARPCCLQKEILLEERTKNLKDVSMEMTTAVSTKLCSLQEDTLFAERTKNLKDVSMEITTAVPIRPCSLQKETLFAECTKNLKDVSMEMTTAVSTKLCSLQKGTLFAERTKNLKDVSMEMTTAVPTKLCRLQEDTLYTDHTKNFMDVSMEMTVAVPIESQNLQEEGPCAKPNKNYNDVSMEMTTAVPIRPCGLQKETLFAERTKNLADVSMEMTVAVPIESQDLQDGESFAMPNKNYNDVSMEMTTAVPIRPCGLQKEILSAECTEKLMDVSMEETTAVSTKLCSLQKETLPVAHMKVTYDLQEGRQNKTSTMCQDASVDMLQIHSNDVNLESDKNKIVGDNLMAAAAVVPFLNQINVSDERLDYFKRNTNIQESEKIDVIPQIFMEITEAVPSLHSIPKKNDAVMNMSETRQTILPEKVNSRTSSTNSLIQITPSDDVVKDITMLVVPSLSNSSESSKEKNYTINKSENSEDKIIKEPTSSELPSLVNIETHTAMHDSLMQDICASALNGDNSGMACATLNTISNDFLCTVTPDVSQGTFLPHEHSQDILSHPRRTYTIKPLSTDHSFLNTINEHSKNLGMSNDVQDVDSVQAQASFENCSTFFNRSVEELESIKPPSFLCLDNSLEDISVNTNYSQEVETEKEIVSSLRIVEGSPEVTEYGKTQILDLQEAVNVSGKQNSLETSHFRLSHGATPSTINKDLECSSSTLNNSQRISTFNVINPPRDKDTHSNSNIENDVMEQSILDKDVCAAYTEENHLQNDELELHKDAMEIEWKEIGPQVSLVNKDVTIKLDPFSSLLKELRASAESDNIIWEIYHENIEKKMFITGFMSCSLLVVIYLEDDYDVLGSQSIKDIKMISRLADDAGDLISIVHKLILEKIDTSKLIDLYKSVNDILSMLDHVSKEVKLAMEFMFELDRLKDRNLMNVTRESVSFVSFTKRMDIILRVTVILKPFEKIKSDDISVQFLLGSSGSVRDEVIKKLLKNIKKDHNFLRRFINDVQDYIYLMEVCDAPTKVPF